MGLQSGNFLEIQNEHGWTKKPEPQRIFVNHRFGTRFVCGDLLVKQVVFMAILKFIALLSLLYTTAAFFMYLRQESFLFYPTKTRHIPDSTTNIQAYTLLQTGTAGKGVTLHGWLVNPQYSKERIIIYFGGNGEDVFLNIDEFEEIQAASLFVNYRGYGSSEGVPGESEMYGDALAIFDDIEKRYAPQKIFLMGRSLGSGIATYVASKRQSAGVILVTPYSSITAIAQSRFRWLPVSLLLKHKFESYRYAAKITAPVLVLYGGADRTVPPANTESLLTSFKTPVQTLFLETAEHGTIDMHQEYWQAILTFIFGETSIARPKSLSHNEHV